MIIIKSSRNFLESISTKVLLGLLGEVIIRLSKIFIVIKIAKILGPTELGRYNFAIANIGIFSFIFDFGISTIAISELSKQATRFNYLSFIYLKLFLVITGFASIIIYSLLNNVAQGDLYLLILLCISQVITEISTFANVFFRVANQVWKETFWRFLISFIQFICVICFFNSKTTLDFLIILLTLSSCIGLYPIFHQYFQRTYPNETKFLQNFNFFHILKISFPIGFTALISSINSNLDLVLLHKYISPELYGNYSLAVKTIFGLIIMPAYYLQLTILADVSKLSKSKDLYYLHNYWSRYYKYSIIIGFVSVFIIVFFCKIIIFKFFGNGYYSSLELIKLFSLASLMYYVYTPLINLMIVYEKRKYVFYSQALSLIVNITLSFVFIPLFKEYGAISSVLFSHFTIMLFNFIFILKSKVIEIKYLRFNFLFFIFLLSLIVISLSLYN